jgi:aryl-alcohol dehydrogenase-like predicted oxidoreductase
MSTFALGHTRVRRSGYGAMQLAGPVAFRTPPDRASAIGVLRAAVAAGVDHIDTAQYYGPGVVNDLIRAALYPYPDGLAIVSKVAVRRDDSGAVLPFDEPNQLREGIEDNLRSLRTGQLAAVNLRLTGDGPVVIHTAARLEVTPAQVALHWLLQLASNVLPIPGTGSIAHLRENLAAEGVTLDDEALRELDGVDA